jgi:hypothetical protein
MSVAAPPDVLNGLPSFQRGTTRETGQAVSPVGFDRVVLTVEAS